MVSLTALLFRFFLSPVFFVLSPDLEISAMFSIPCSARG